MNFQNFLHSNIYVLDLEKSIDFYNKALGLKEVDRLDTPEFTLVIWAMMNNSSIRIIMDKRSKRSL